MKEFGASICGEGGKGGGEEIYVNAFTSSITTVLNGRVCFAIHNGHRIGRVTKKGISTKCLSR